MYRIPAEDIHHLIAYGEVLNVVHDLDLIEHRTVLYRGRVYALSLEYVGADRHNVKCWQVSGTTLMTGSARCDYNLPATPKRFLMRKKCST